MRKKTGWSRHALVRLVPTWSTAEEATCLDKAHTPDSSKELCVSLIHTRHNQMAAKEDGSRLRELPLGDPCRPGCMEAGWLQPRTRGRLAALWAGPGRVVGTVSGRVLLAFLAGGAWDGSPGMLVQGSWGPQVEAEGKGREPR